MVKVTVTFNGIVIYQGANTQPQNFENVKVYSGNPWNTQAPAQIKNLVLKTGIFRSHDNLIFL